MYISVCACVSNNEELMIFKGSGRYGSSWKWNGGGNGVNIILMFKMLKICKK